MTLQKQLRQHYDNWRTCQLCSLGTDATHHVLYDFKAKGKDTLEVVFIGEAPGVSEDAIGKPFVGRSGKVLRGAIELYEEGISWGITNTVCCRPTQEENGIMRNRQPDPEEIKSCYPRLEQFLKIANPKVVVCVGKSSSASILRSKWPAIKFYSVLHPSYILRCGGESSAEGVGLKREIQRAFEEIGRVPLTGKALMDACNSIGNGPTEEDVKVWMEGRKRSLEAGERNKDELDD